MRINIFFGILFSTVLSTTMVFAATTAIKDERKNNVELMEMNGRGCYGYFQVTPRYLDFYTPFLDCHRMAYSQFSKSDRPLQLEEKSYDSVWMFIDKPTKMCPFDAIEILIPSDPEAYESRQILGYPSKDDFEKYRWGIDQSTGAYVGSAKLLSCPAYLLEPSEKPPLKSERKRAKPQVKK